MEVAITIGIKFSCVLLLKGGFVKSGGGFGTMAIGLEMSVMSSA